MYNKIGLPIQSPLTEIIPTIKGLTHKDVLKVCISKSSSMTLKKRSKNTIDFSPLGFICKSLSAYNSRTSLNSLGMGKQKPDFKNSL